MVEKAAHEAGTRAAGGAGASAGIDDAAESGGGAAPVGAGPRVLSRRALIRGVAGSAVLAGAAATLAACTPGTASAGASASKAASGAPASASASTLFAELDAKILALMKKYKVPGSAVGVWYKGAEHVRGFGVTNVEDPQPVTGDTLFRIGSTTKTVTGTAMMRLVEQGKVGLDAPVRTYLPDFATSDPSVAWQVTVRQLLNHSPGWLGDNLVDYGRGDNALAEYVAGVARVPQQTPLGSTFQYNNTAIGVAGRIIEVVTGSTYEDAARSLVLDPLKLAHTGFFADEMIGYRFAAPHQQVPAAQEVPGKAVVNRSDFYLPRSLNSIGGLLSSARDQLAYARFHLAGTGVAADGKQILSPAALKAMRSNPGPGGTLLMELTGIGVTWMLVPSAEGVTIVQHGGSWPGYESGFLFVPGRDFAMTLLTNSSTGNPAVGELLNNDWALSRFAGLHNPPADPKKLSAADLAPYVGRYRFQEIDGTGAKPITKTSTLQLTAHNGRLRMSGLDENGKELEPPTGGAPELALYRDDYVRPYDSDGNPLAARSNFIRDANGKVQWLRNGGRLGRKIS
ncbi:serine hydrolase domain-containing protein [Rathayibacter soli]|uniref:serine hydrolase domain-containing protein n=1 Tax=Rathayibacter soli TaxID=3144168 RepID=UPI0027E3DAF1|nr:serine hydrolase domain-containing protein [Glaciibacter superstes]